jgi:hypothetical protein
MTAIDNMKAVGAKKVKEDALKKYLEERGLSKVSIHCDVIARSL